MLTRGQWLALVCFSLQVGFAPPVQAHCQNARDLCKFAVDCILNPNPNHNSRIRDGVKNNIGGEIWGELQGCYSGGNLEEKGAKDCKDGDYVSVASAALLVVGGNSNACNALAE